MDGNDQSGLFDELNSLVPAQGQQPAAAAPAPAQNDLFADLDSLIPRSNPGPVGVSAAQMPQLDSTLANVGKQFAYGAVADGFSRIPEGVAITAANIQNKTVRGLNSPEEGGARTIEKNKLIARLRGPEGQDPQNAKEILAQLTDMGIAESEIRGLLERGPISAKDIPDYHYGEDLRRATRGALGGVNENDTSTSGQIARMAGGFTGMAVGAAATGAVAGPAAAALYAAGQGATLNESMIYDDAIAAGADEETAQQAAQLGGAAGAAMAIPVLNSLKFLPSAVKSKITNAFLGQIAQVSEKSGTAAALMYAQTVGNNLIAQTSYDENRSLAEGGWEALLTGAVFGVVGHAISEAPGAVKALKFNPAELGPAEKPAPSTAAEATAEIAPDVAVALGAKDPAALVDEIMGGSQAAQVTPGGKVDVKAADATPKDVTGSAAQGAENAKASDGTTTEAKNPATVEIEQLKDRKNPRKAVFIPFTDTTTEPPHGAGIMMEPTDAGVIYYHTGKGIGKAGVKALLKSGQAANVLKIGPYTKAMMGADTPAAPEATVTAPEVAPEAAPAAPVAPVPSEAAQALSALSKAPEASVAAPSEASVAADRLPAAPEPAAPAPSEAAAAVERLVPPELDYSKYAEEAPAPAPEPVAAEPVAREAAPTAPAAKPKVEVIKAKSRAKSGKPAAVDKSEAKSTEEPAKVKVVKPAVEEQPAVAREQIDPKTGKRQFILKTSEEVKKASDRFNRPIQDRMRNEGLSSAEVAATKRPEAYDEINRAADAGEMDPRTEAQARQDNSGSKISKAEKERAVEDNVRAAEIMKLHADRPFEQVATMEDIGPIKERLDAVLLAANEAGITIPERVSTTTANATAWLTDVKMMASKLARAKAIGSNKRSAFVKDLNSWLVDEAVAAKGDSGPMRARRKLVGEQISGGRIAGGSDVENLVGDVIGASDARDNVGAEINNDSAARNAEAPASRGQSSKGSARLSDGSEKREVVVGRDKDGKARVAQVTAAKAASEVRKVDPASIGLTQDRIDAMFAETSKADKTRVAVDEASAAETRAAKPENEVKDDIAVITPAGKEAAKTRRKPQTMAEAKAELARLVAEDKARREAGKLPEEDPDYPIARKEADGTTGARPWDAANQTPEDRARERLFNEEFAGKEEDFDHAETSVNELANELIDPDGMLNSSSKTRKIVRTDDEAQRTMTQSAEALDVLLANAEDIKVIVVRDADMEHYTGSAMGYYDPIMDRIVIAQKWLMDAADALAVLVHETAHAVFYHKLESDKLVRGKMQILLNAARDQAVGKQADHYGLTDVHEFTSELWGNTRFQDMLSQMHLSLEEAKSLGLKMADRGRIRNLLDAFKKVLFDALGLEKLRPANSTDLSLLNLGLEVSKELLAGSKTARGNRETIMARLIEQQTAKNDLKFAKDERKAGTLKLPTVNPPEGVAGYGRQDRSQLWGQGHPGSGEGAGCCLCQECYLGR